MSRLKLIGGALFYSCILSGCTISGPPEGSATGESTRPPEAVTSSAATQATTVPAPSTQPAAFVLREAALPKDFPPPGPVGEVIYKEYPAYRAVRTRAKEGNGQDGMFMSLFNHIQKNEIAMTAPVEMNYDATVAGGGEPTPRTMAFIYGEPTIGKPGDDGNVEVIDVPAMSMLSVGIRGSYNGDQLKSGLDLIQRYLREHPGQYQVTGSPRSLGYNSPFVPPFMRFGEVQVPVKRVAGR